MTTDERKPTIEPVAAERDRCIAAIRSVQAAYDAKLGPGPSVEASVCSDCIGAIQAAPPAAARVPLTPAQQHADELFRLLAGVEDIHRDACEHAPEDRVYAEGAMAEAWQEVRAMIAKIEAASQEVPPKK